jgi:hypothetical protein
VLSEKKLTLADFEATFRTGITSIPGIAGVFSRQEIESAKLNSPHFRAIQKSYQKERSGDYFILISENYIYDEALTGTSHGSPYDYDTHVPLLFRSDIIAKGIIGTRVGIADIAPTIAKCLSLSFHDSRDGKNLPIRIIARPKFSKAKKK